MNRAGRICSAGLLATFLAFACSPDTIDLLPPSSAGQASMVDGGSGGNGGTVGGTTGGATGGLPSTAGGSGGVASASGGGAGGSNGGTDGGACNGVGCGGLGEPGGFAGEGGGNYCDDFQLGCPCGPQDRCASRLKCNLRIGKCAFACDNPFQCSNNDEWLCEENTCVRCSTNDQCEEFGAFGRRFCVDGRCQQCEEHGHCTLDSPFCWMNRCIQCRTDDDCPGSTCDLNRFRCEK